MGATVANGHSGRKSDPSVAVLTPAANGLTLLAVNVTPVVTILTPPLSSVTPLFLGNRLDMLEKKQFFEYNEIAAGAQI